MIVPAVRFRVWGPLHHWCLFPRQLAPAYVGTHKHFSGATASASFIKAAVAFLTRSWILLLAGANWQRSLVTWSHHGLHGIRKVLRGHDAPHPDLQSKL